MEFGLFTLLDFYPGKQDERQYYRDTIDLALRGEELGFTSFWAGEEHFYSFGVCPSPQILLAALARETQSMRLGTAISLLPFENPLRKAEDFAMVDILSGGRLDFGVGRGSIAKHFYGFGVDGSESRERYEESLVIIKKAWTEDSFSYPGKFWSVPELSVSPHPVQQPMPPVYRGTVSLESYEAAAIAGDSAFVVPWTTAPHAEIRKRLDLYRRVAAEHGHAGLRETSIFFLFCDEDHDAAMREAKAVTETYSSYITSHSVARDKTKDPKSALFSVADFIRSIPSHLEERTVVGTPAECIERLETFNEELGLDRVAFYLHPGARDIAAARRSIELFAKEVMPHFGAVPVV